MENRDVRGRIFDIQKFSVHDGPGIRTIIFLKGCMFKCKWCCNPEGQSFDIQTMTMDGKTKTVGQDITVGELMDIVACDMPYYRRSGGGVTLSGGETFLQPDFAAAIFKECKKMGINTAVESTGALDFKNIEKSLEFIDYFLMDIKHMNSDKHKQYIGTGNERVLLNAAKIANAVKSYSVRVPVVPGFNDTEEEIGAIAEFAASLKTVDKMHLLPYHRLGQDKYKGIGREYELNEILPPTDEKMERLLNAAKRHFEKCVIGG